MIPSFSFDWKITLPVRLVNQTLWAKTVNIRRERIPSTFRRWNQTNRLYAVCVNATIDNNGLRSTYINKTFWTSQICPDSMGSNSMPLTNGCFNRQTQCTHHGIRYSVHFMCLWVYGHGRIIFLLEHCNIPKCCCFRFKANDSPTIFDRFSNVSVCYIGIC